MKRQKQQIHKICGGEICVVADSEGYIEMVCKSCAMNWSSGYKIVRPKEWRNVIKGVVVISKA